MAENVGAQQGHPNDAVVPAQEIIDALGAEIGRLNVRIVMLQAGLNRAGGE